MPKPLNQQEFEALQRSTNTVRADLRKQQQDLQAARLLLVKSQADLRAEQAKGNYADPTIIATLQQEVQRNSRDVETYSGIATQFDAQVNDLIGEILFELDPRALVGLLDDKVPVFLMPLRVETRFMTVKHITRLAPDRAAYVPSPGIQIVGGEPMRILPDARVEDIFNFHRVLPVIEDAKELWVRVYPDDIAIHTHERPLTELEVEAGKTFWTAIWYAGPDEALRIGAWRGLVSGRGSERAAWVLRQMRPINQTSQPATTTAPDLALPVLPDFPLPPLKDAAWTQMPHSKVMPDRLVVRLYSGSNYREVVGKPIPDPLPVSLDPTDELNTIDTAGGDLKLPDKLRWMQEFDAAEQIGMGFRIPLSDAEALYGFTRVIVTGVKTSADKEEGKALIEELFENHRYTKTGLSIVPQGTPTNNTDDTKAGHTEDTSDDEDLFVLAMTEALFTPSNDPAFIKDGQYLADALGIDYAAVQQVRHADHTDIKEAMCMNTALWPTTLGYYSRHLLHPLFTENELSRMKSHFNSFVLGRGRIPAIRVGSQPYGILATSAYSHYTFNTTGNTEAVFLDKLHRNILQPMEQQWEQLAYQVEHAKAYHTPSEKTKQFLDIIGLHPASVEFYQRFVSGKYFLWNLYNYSSFISGASSPNQVSYANSLQFSLAFGNIGLASLHAPRVFDFTYVKEQKYLNGPVIDRLKLSEERRVETMGTNGENYLDWLIMSNWERIRNEDFSNIGAPNATPPKALLYLMLRHSCLLEYVRTSLTYLVNNGLISAHSLLDHELVNYTLQTTLTPEVQASFRSNLFMAEGLTFEANLDDQVQTEFIARANSGVLNGITLRQLQDQQAGFRDQLRGQQLPDLERQVDQLFQSEVSRLQIPSTKVGLLTDAYPFMTSGATLHEFVYDKILSAQDVEMAEMQELVRAITCLKDVPTARLERCFAEHIDLVSYRLDAWFTSLASNRLQRQRYDKSQRVTGLYVGAYGWLEDVRPGSFPGIHYQEVDTTEETIYAVGFTRIDTSAVPQYNFRIEPKDIWGPIDPAAVGGLRKPSASQSPVAPVEFGREIPLDPVYRQYTFLAVPAPEFTSLGFGSQKNLNVQSTLDNVLVDQPFPVLEAMPWDSTPKVVYLGTDSLGDIMYDGVKDRYIHRPRIDTNNNGYIHAPSINQATAAAVLRAGYASHKVNPGSPDTAMAVNLSSARVRRALWYIEGLKNGQELGALLGYQFERGLHDSELSLDAFIYDIRLKFPLVAGRVTATTATFIREAESYNVVNGLALLQTTTPYPYGVTWNGTPPNAAQATEIQKQVNDLRNALDAINDLLMSEAMYQVVQGNHPRAGNALNALSGKGIPADPQVIQTPRSFKIISHRIGVQFDLSAGGHAIWTAAAMPTVGTPRSVAEPALNRWLSTMLPAPTKIKFNYGYRFVAFDGELGTLYGGSASAADLGIEPIDLYALLSQPAEQGDAVELVQRIGWHVQRNVLSAPNVRVEIAFEDRTGLNPDDITLNELQPLMAQLRTVVGDSRPLDAKDYLLSADAANPSGGVAIGDVVARLLDTQGLTMSNLERGLQGVLADLGTQRSALIPLLPDLLSLNELDPLADALRQAAAFGVPNAMPTITADSLEATGQALIDQAARVITDIQKRDAAATAELAIAQDLTKAETLRLNALTKAAQAIFGRNFRIFPEYTPLNPIEVEAAVLYPDYLAFAGPEAVEKWLQGLSPVRKRIRGWHQAGLLSEALTGVGGQLDLSIAQLPLLPVDGSNNPVVRWLGVEFPAGYETPDEVISLLMSLPSAYAPLGKQAGLLIDAWTEEIPESVAHTGIAVHYNNPDSEPAQVCLLAVSPNETGAWSWDDLMDTVVETLDWAKKRAVDPDQLSKTLFAQVLPATYAAISGTDDSPTLDYGRNIIKRPQYGVFDMIKIKDFNL